VVESDTAGNEQEPLKFAAEPLARRHSERDLAGVLHEVSNALTVVLGWIDRARSDTECVPSVEDALSIASSRARHARHIVRRAIGAEVPDDVPMTVSAIIAEAAMGLDPEAKRAGCVLRSMVDPVLDSVTLAEPSSIVQILTNLLLNAISVSPPHGVVELDAALEGAEYVVFGVSDEGPGVPPDRRATLLSAGISTRAGGAGIGLRYAAALAREAGGALVLSRAEPSARFELRWPRVRARLSRSSERG